MLEDNKKGIIYMEEKRPKFPTDSEESHRIMIEALEMVGFNVRKPNPGEEGGFIYKDENGEIKKLNLKDLKNLKTDKPIQSGNTAEWLQVIGENFGDLVITYNSRAYRCSHCRKFSRHRFPYCHWCGFSMKNGNYEGDED